MYDLKTLNEMTAELFGPKDDDSTDTMLRKRLVASTIALVACVEPDEAMMREHINSLGGLLSEVSGSPILITVRTLDDEEIEAARTMAQQYTVNPNRMN